MKVKHLIYLLFAGTIACSCGGSDESTEAGDYSQEDLVVKTSDDSDASATTNSSRVSLSLDPKKADTISGFQLTAEFINDRAIALKKYKGKTLFITDLLLYDVYIPENAFGPKGIKAYPCNLSNNFLAKEWGRYDGQFYMNGNQLFSAGYSAPISFTLDDPSALAKFKIEKYEGAYDNDFLYLMDIYGIITSSDNVSFDGKSRINENMKANWITIDLPKAIIVNLTEAPAFIEEDYSDIEGYGGY